jgi:hypothetical protein
MRARFREWYASNRDAQLERMRQYHADNQPRLAEVKKAYNHANRERWREINAYRMANDPNYRLGKSLRSNLVTAVKRNAQTGSAIRDIGCSVDELKAYLATMFRDGMSWDNWRTIWQIDHIRPVMSFDLTDRAQFLQAAHYTNLQPLLVQVHRAKSVRERNYTMAGVSAYLEKV